MAVDIIIDYDVLFPFIVSVKSSCILLDYILS